MKIIILIKLKKYFNDKHEKIPKIRNFEYLDKMSLVDVEKYLRENDFDFRLMRSVLYCFL